MCYSWKLALRIQPQPQVQGAGRSGQAIGRVLLGQARGVEEEEGEEEGEGGGAWWGELGSRSESATRAMV